MVAIAAMVAMVTMAMKSPSLVRPNAQGTGPLPSAQRLYWAPIMFLSLGWL